MRLQPGYWVVAGVLVAVVLAIAIGLRLGAPGAVVSNAPVTTAPKAPVREGLDVKGLSFRQYGEGGELQWQVVSSGKLKADRAKLHATGENVRWELKRAGGASLLVDAPKLEVDYETKQVSFPAGLAAESATEKLKFSAGRMAYDIERQVLVAQDGVKGQFGDYEGSGQRLELARLSTRATLSGDVTVGMRDMSLQAQQAVVNTASRRAVITGDVRATRAAYTVTAGRVDADAAAGTVRLSGGARLSRGALVATAPEVRLAQKAEVAEASGGVNLRGEGFTAQGARLRVDGKAQSAELSGGVRAKVNLAR